MDVTQPIGMRKFLLPHQLESVRMMENLECNQIAIPQYSPESESDNSVVTFTTQLGVNADITGYGKTISMIALIMRNVRPWEVSEKYIETVNTPMAHGLVHRKVDRIYDKLMSTVILAPSPVLTQWESEIMETDLTFISVTSKKDVNRLDADPIQDVILVSPTVFNYFVDKYHQKAWYRFIFDEPSHLRIPSMRRIIAGFTWFVTATPALITSRHKNCNSNYMNGIICKWTDFEYTFKDIIIANDPQFVRASFDMPPTIKLEHPCLSQIYSTLSSLPNVVDSHILEMVAADDIGGAVKALGGNTTDDIVSLLKDRKQEEVNEIKLKIYKYSRQGRHTMHTKWTERLEAKLSELQKIEQTMHERMHSSCAICSDSLNNPIVEPSCQNLFCGSCLMNWLRVKKTCPLCRADVPLTELIVEVTKNVECPPILPVKSKHETLASLIKHKPSAKFVIFSEFPASFDIIGRTLGTHNISYTEMTGDSKNQLNALTSFRNGNSQVLFLRSIENGAGLNLQCASDIVFYHTVTQLTEHQVIGRANRIGRKHPLTVHTLIAEQ